MSLQGQVFWLDQQEISLCLPKTGDLLTWPRDEHKDGCWVDVCSSMDQCTSYKYL